MRMCIREGAYRAICATTRICTKQHIWRYLHTYHVYGIGCLYQHPDGHMDSMMTWCCHVSNVCTYGMYVCIHVHGHIRVYVHSIHVMQYHILQMLLHMDIMSQTMVSRYPPMIWYLESRTHVVNMYVLCVHHICMCAHMHRGIYVHMRGA